MKKQRLRIGLIVLIIIAGLVSWQWFFRQQSNHLVLYGNVDIRTVNLAFRVAGRLASLTVDEGDVVQPGMLLGKLDDAPYINALNEAKANALAAKAQLDLAQAGYRDEEIAQVRSALNQQQAVYDYANTFLQRQRKLWNQHLISANDLDNAVTSRNQAKSNLQAAKDKLREYLKGNRPQQIENAQAQLAQAQAAVDQAALNLKDTQLISPAKGTILTRAVEPGSMLSVGAAVFNLSLTRPVWIRAYVDESHLDQAIPDRRVAIYTDGRPDKPYHGKIGFISPTAEFTPKSVETPDLRTELVYRLRIIVTVPNDSLRQGMPVTLQLLSTE